MADYDVYDHSDIQPSCMDLDINGQKLILGGKKCLAVLNASDPEKAGAKFYRRNKFDVSCIKFCPHDDNKQQIIASSSQYYEIYNLQQSGIQMLATGKAHSRNVTDVDWDHFNSYQFATCSVDDSVNLWDVRDCKRPAQSFNIIAGAYQIKWCRKIEHIFATAHEGDVRLWDTRKITSPIQFIAAHLSKVLSLDWHWKNEASFVSSSLDRTVKVFDFMKPNDPEIHFCAPGPVWKARFATFADAAVLTIPFPQVGRTEHNISLWNIGAAPAAAVVHTFGGYQNVVLDFCVRNTPTNDGDAPENLVQLYTLCKDGSMRLWTIDGRMQMLCSQKGIFDSSSTMPNSFSDVVLPIDGRNFNFSNFMETFVDENFQAAAAPSSINLVENLSKQMNDGVFLGGDQNQQKLGLEIPCSSPFNVFKIDGAPINWERELITLSSIVLPNITIEEVNRETKTVVIVMRTKAYRPIRFRISSSVTYQKSPNGDQRQISFQFLSYPSVSNLISNNAKIQILKVLQESLSANRADEESVFEVCLKQLSSCLDQCLSDNESSDTQPSTASPNAASIGELFASYINARVPFPATCGARFCGPGYLVCFARKPESEICCAMSLAQPVALNCAVSPRSYGDLLNLARERKELQNGGQQQTYFAASIPRDPFSLSNFYYPNRQWIATRKKPRVDSTTGLHYALDKVDLDDETCSDLHVYDCSRLFPFSKDLAQLYRLDTKDPASACAQNAAMLNQKGRKELAKLWRLLEKCAERSFAKINSQFDSPWPLTPLGRKLIDQLINHYGACGDFQTAALICCAFGSKIKIRPKSYAFSRKLSMAFGQRPVEQGSDSVYNTIHGTYGNHIKESLSTQRHRSNSFTEEAEIALTSNYNLNDDLLLTPISENGNNGHHLKAAVSKDDSVLISSLDPTRSTKYERVCLAYADLLHRWNLLNERTQIMQYSRIAPEQHEGVEYRMLCRKCNTECASSSSYCHSCRSSVGFLCFICKFAVKGLTSICAVCLHGGHTKHMLSWFQEHNKCPSGCGCTCSYA